MIPYSNGLITQQHIVATLGDLLLEPNLYTRKADDISLFKSVGLSVEDVVIAKFIYEEALRRGAGERISW